MVMTVKYLSGTEKQESRNLWEEAFPEDSRSFDDYYYAEKVKDNRILAIVEGAGADARNERRRPGATGLHSQDLDGAESVRNRTRVQRSGVWRVDAMIQLNPYRLHVADLRWNVDYIVGVATRKDKRHRGYMSTLLTKMMADMRAERMPFCFLMPADPAIYRPFGFTYIFDQPKLVLDESKAGGLKRKPLIPEMNSSEYEKRLREASEWLENWLGEHYQVYAVRDEDYLRRQVKEIGSENGSLDVLYDDNQIVGMQSIWGWEEQEHRFLYVDDRYVKNDAVSVKPAIMARIISPELFLRTVHLKEDAEEQEMKLHLRIEDPLIEENNRTWIWTLNRMGSKVERIYEDIFADPKMKKTEVDLTLTITELTEWMFGYHIPKQAEVYADKIAVFDPVFLDEVV